MLKMVGFSGGRTRTMSSRGMNLSRLICGSRLDLRSQSEDDREELTDLVM